MENIEFLKFDLTPTEKHVGIATIRVERKYIFRFKVMTNPKGEGFFTNAPAIKIGETYFASFQFDSSYEADEVKSFILSQVKKQMNSQQVQQDQNIFPPTQQQPTFQFEQAPF